MAGRGRWLRNLIVVAHAVLPITCEVARWARELRNKSGKGGFFSWNWGEDFYFWGFGGCAPGARNAQHGIRVKGEVRMRWRPRAGIRRNSAKLSHPMRFLQSIDTQ